MTEKVDHVPDWKPNAERTGITGELHTDDGEFGQFEHSDIPLTRAEEVSAEVRALGDKFEREGPAVLGWALQWMADDMDRAIAQTVEQRSKA